MNFQVILESIAKDVEKEQMNILIAERKNIQKISSKLVPLFDHFMNSNTGGKKIRGFLIKLGFELNGGRNKEIIKVAAAYEILHNSILIHDDIIDKSPKRRGQPSLYKKVGIEQAITLSDLGFFLSMKVISESKFKENLKIKALNLFSKTMVETTIGQMMDVSKGDIFTIMKLKTAKYTVSAPFKLGAILNGADEQFLNQLGLFGENLGIAFQIKDDILDGDINDVEKAEHEILQYANKAKKLIQNLSKQKKMRKLLHEMVNYMIERKN